MKYVFDRINETKLELDNTVGYMAAKIREVVKKFGPRAPGSDAENNAQQFLAEDLEKWSDEVTTEEFTVHRQAFMGFIPFTVALAIISTFLYWFGYTLTGFLLNIIAAVPLVLEFVMYKRFCDPLFPGHTSHNVIAVRKPSGETKKRIIYIAHCDSQYEWTLNYKLGGNGMKCFLIPAVVGLVACTIACLVKFVTYLNIQPGQVHGADVFFQIVGIILFLFIVPYIGFLFFQNPFRSVPGATDNLSGCLVSMSVLKHMAENDIRFEHTEVCVILSGSEEAGLRGSKAYVEAHEKELKSTKSVVIACDTIRDLKYMAVYDRDLSGTLKHDKQTKELLRDAAKDCGHDLPFASIYIGACDAASFTQKGIKATGFAAMDPTPPRYYHTRLDTPDLVEPEALKVGAEILLETAFRYDENGLKD